MFTRREFLEHTLKTSSLVALSSAVPGFLATTARAAAPGKDTVLVVLEMTGGNDGLNTVVPYTDDLYYKNRPTLGLRKEQLVRVDEHIGLHPALRPMDKLLQNSQLAVIQGVGYPNPDRSHFESMDIWQSADPKRKTGNGWLGRSISLVPAGEGHIPAMHVGTDELPLAMQGSSTGVPSIHPTKPYDLSLGAGAPISQPRRASAKPATPAKQAPASDQRTAQRRLIQELAELSPTSSGSLLQFVQRSALQTYTTIDRLRAITQASANEGVQFFAGAGRRYGELAQNLNLVARIIQGGFGTRVFYVSIGNFDTHAGQLNMHQNLLAEMAGAIGGFFDQLEASGNAKRVLLMTFSEFGRRVKENGSKGTDHGAASCMFVAGPGAKGGPVGKHPSLAELDSGDLKHHTDFRQVYATLLDKWLACDSRAVLGGKFDHVALLK